MVAREKGTAKGRNGWWFATVTAPTFSEDLPCVHRHWLKGAVYDDPFAGDGQPEWPEFVSAIKKGQKVILTEDLVTPGADNAAPSFKRLGYIAVFKVAEVQWEDKHLRFRLTDRFIDLR